ncbi:hypothetical protein GQ42DRAFT_176862 [Ramicandelaber brevisporus]|nr:hypothetical protein GQ42DRAFT_176862 [Ramicandelaber brevisporus]
MTVSSYTRAISTDDVASNGTPESPPFQCLCPLEVKVQKDECECGPTATFDPHGIVRKFFRKHDIFTVDGRKMHMDFLVSFARSITAHHDAGNLFDAEYLFCIATTYEARINGTKNPDASHDRAASVVELVAQYFSDLKAVIDKRPDEVKRKQLSKGLERWKEDYCEVFSDALGHLSTDCIDNRAEEPSDKKTMIRYTDKMVEATVN